METTQILFIIANLIVVIGLAFANKFYRNLAAHNLDKYSESRKEYNRLYMLYEDKYSELSKVNSAYDNAVQRIESYKQMVTIRDAAIDNLKKQNHHLRLSRNGIKGAYVLQLKKQQQLHDCHVNALAHKIDVLSEQVDDLKLENQILGERVQELQSDDKKLKEDDIIDVTGQTDIDLPIIGTKFKFNGGKYEVIKSDICEGCCFIDDFNCLNFNCCDKQYIKID